MRPNKGKAKWIVVVGDAQKGTTTSPHVRFMLHDPSSKWNAIKKATELNKREHWDHYVMKYNPRMKGVFV